MEYKEVVETIKKSEERVDEVLKAARLQRHEKTPMQKEKLELILDYVVKILEIVFCFAFVFMFFYFMSH